MFFSPLHFYSYDTRTNPTAWRAMGLDSGSKGAHGTRVSYTFTRASEEDSERAGNGGRPRNRRQKRGAKGTASAGGLGKAAGMPPKKKTAKPKGVLRVKGRLITKVDISMLDEFMKAGYV